MTKGGLSKYWMDGESWHAINSHVPHSQGQASSSLVINLFTFLLRGNGTDVYIVIVMNSNTAGILISEPYRISLSLQNNSLILLLCNGRGGTLVLSWATDLCRSKGNLPGRG